MKILNQQSYDYKKAKAEKGGGISQTVPNMALTIPQLLTRYSRGLPLGGARTPVYNDDPSIPDFDRIELTDYMDWMAEKKEQITKLQKDYYNANKKSNNADKAATEGNMGSDQSGDPSK